MTAVVTWLDAVLSFIPLPVLEVWGRFSYAVGLFVAICAFCGFTFRIGDHWGFGRARQRWDTKAFLSIPLTCVLIIASGYIGSFIVLVPGAQTFESLKDVAVLLCVVGIGVLVTRDLLVRRHDSAPPPVSGRDPMASYRGPPARPQSSRSRSTKSPSVKSPD